jgi:hypothetical protein
VTIAQPRSRKQRDEGRDLREVGGGRLAAADFRRITIAVAERIASQRDARATEMRVAGRRGVQSADKDLDGAADDALFYGRVSVSLTRAHAETVCPEQPTPPQAASDARPVCRTALPPDGR